MYIIAVYDLESRRTVKMLKLLRRYLNWIQNSVFEGELDEADLQKMQDEAREIMKDEDSLIIFKTRQEKWLERIVIGEERSSIDNFL